MPFSNPIIGGDGILVREEIRSPNYVAGTSGWSINRDGTAEFLDAVIRGEIIVGDAPTGDYIEIDPNTFPPAIRFFNSGVQVVEIEEFGFTFSSNSSPNYSAICSTAFGSASLQVGEDGGSDVGMAIGGGDPTPRITGTTDMIMRWITEPFSLVVVIEQDNGVLKVTNEVANETAGVFPTGGVTPFAGSTAPAGWLTCDGSAVSRTAYADLFAVIGTTYGAGDGSTTFNVPDLRGNVPAGFNSGDVDFNTLGQTGGAKQHSHPLSDAGHARILVSTSSPPGVVYRQVNTANWNRTHDAAGITRAAAAGATGAGTGLGGDTDASSTTEGMSPYIVLAYIIKT